MENLKLFGLLATTPLVIAKKFGWAFAGIWLLVDRDWAPLIQGIIFIFLGHATLSFALMPSVAMMRFGTTLFTKGGPAKALGSMFITLGGLLHYLPFVFYIFLLYTIIFDNRFLSPPWVVAIWVFSLAGDTFGYLGRREAAASGGVLTPKLFCSSRGRHSCSYLGLWDGGAVVAMDSLRRQSLLANYLGCNNLRPRHQRNDPHTEPSQRRIISF